VSTGRLPAAGRAINRRIFVQSVLTAIGGGLAGGVAAQTQRERRSNGWIIPTNKPDRFNLKVMAFNPIPAPDPGKWDLSVEGAGDAGTRLKVADLDKLPRIAQSSRLKCVQCWSGRVNWEGFRAQDLLRLVGARTNLLWVRVDCADKYYDFVKLEDLLHPRTLFALGMNGEALSPEHGAPLRLVMPAKYGYKSSKLITKLTFVDKGGMGLVADGWPYYSASGDILAGVDHPFEFPDETRKIVGGEITDY
jgi:DMSO/TMAO reductase YedYZ molybdopterin-dependent catalytic subunit